MSITWPSHKIMIVLLLLLAGGAGIAGFMHSRYVAATLVLQVRTLEKGPGRVEVTDDRGIKTVREFVIADDRGETIYYPIELPRVLPAAVHIAPLGSPGSFAFDRISLQAASLSYSWDAQGGCSRKTLPGGVITYDRCRDGEPLLTINKDLSVTISRIPAVGFAQGGTIRAGIALLLCVGMLLGGGWLLLPVPETHSGDKLAVQGARVCWLAFFSIYLLQLAAIWRYSVDLPFWEEWEYFLPQALPGGLTWDWLFSFSGYHRVVPTKLMAWLNYRLLGLDFTVQKVVNYLIFGGLLLTVTRLKQVVAGPNTFRLFPAFLIFMLSPIAFENHINSYQSQIHLVLICAVAALFYAYPVRLTLSATLLFSFCLLIAINTFSAGMTIAVVYLPCWALYLVVQIARQQIPLRQGVVLAVLHGVLVGAGAAQWIFGYRQPSGFSWVYPDSRLFWETFLHLLSFGFGIENEHLLLGGICLLAVLSPVIMLLCDAEKRGQRGVWQVVTGILGIVAILATASITRGIFAGTARESRYAEFSLLLIPFVSLAWWLALRSRLLRGMVLGCLWTACFLTFLNNWSFAPYRDVRQMSYFVIEQLEEYVAGKGDGAFPWSYSQPLGPFFDGARELDVKFTRQFGGLSKGNPKTP